MHHERPMSSGELPTQRQLRRPVVLLVGGTPALATAVKEAALAAQVLVTDCPVVDVTTVAAEIRPLVMVVSEDIFGFDPESFRALARDVHSRLLTVGEAEIQPGRLVPMLKALVLEAEQGEPDWNEP